MNQLASGDEVKESGVKELCKLDVKCAPIVPLESGSHQGKNGSL